VVGGDNSISGIGLDLDAVSSVIERIEDLSNLVEMMLRDVGQAKKDAKSLLKFLNFLCVEISGNPD